MQHVITSMLDSIQRQFLVALVQCHILGQPVAQAGHGCMCGAHEWQNGCCQNMHCNLHEQLTAGAEDTAEHCLACQSFFIGRIGLMFQPGAEEGHRLGFLLFGFLVR